MDIRRFLIVAGLACAASAVAAQQPALKSGLDLTAIDVDLPTSAVGAGVPAESQDDAQ